MSVICEPMPPSTSPCQHCGMTHYQTCPRIKAIEYHDNGTVKRVEFHEPQPVLAQYMTGAAGAPQIDYRGYIPANYVPRF